jgi:abortive infection bacteriophage resistance protein
VNESAYRRELKPPLTYEQQVEKMKSRNLIIGDETFAIEKLKTNNYYRISAYTLHLKKDDVFLPGTTFEQIIRLYDFDANFRSILTPVLERIEIAFRTHVAYLLANKYGDPLSYREKNCFVNEVFHSKFLEELDREIDRSKEIFAQHHRKKYDGQFPIWVAVELMSFGTLSKLFGNMKNEDQNEIAKEHYSIPGEYAVSWLRTLSYVRNLCAHYARLYNKNLTIKPKLFAREKHRIDNRKIFAAILVMKRLTKEETSWRTFLASLVGLIETYNDVIDLKLIGFPDNWYDLLNC